MNPQSLTSQEAKAEALKFQIQGVRVVGVDLSGPADPRYTALVWGDGQGARLSYTLHCQGADDRKILSVVRQQCDMIPTIVGLDAPLSYEPEGGMRDRDRDLQTVLRSAGMPPDSVMSPSAPRMSDRTSRGISVARAIMDIRARNPATVVEVHPGGAMALAGAPIGLVRQMNEDPVVRSKLVDWLKDNGMTGLPGDISLNEYLLAGAACTLAAWNWRAGRPNWQRPAEPPLHPFDLAC